MWEVLGSSPNGDKNLSIKKKKSFSSNDFLLTKLCRVKILPYTTSQAKEHTQGAQVPQISHMKGSEFIFFSIGKCTEKSLYIKRRKGHPKADPKHTRSIQEVPKGKNKKEREDTKNLTSLHLEPNQ